MRGNTAQAGHLYFGRPASHSKQYTPAEVKLMQDMRRRNPGPGPRLTLGNLFRATGKPGMFPPAMRAEDASRQRNQGRRPEKPFSSAILRNKASNSGPCVQAKKSCPQDSVRTRKAVEKAVYRLLLRSVAGRKSRGSLQNCRLFRYRKRHFRSHISDGDRFFTVFPRLRP